MTSAQKVLRPSGVGQVERGGAQPVPPGTQAAPMQIIPAPQAWPQAPQLPESRDRSVQYEPPPLIGHAFGADGGQVIVPPPPHAPAWQATPIGQARPHEPQFAGSIDTSAQYEPPVADGQLTGALPGQVPGMVPLQTPPMQAWPDGQTLPQRPQLAPSFRMLVQISPPGPKQPLGVAPLHDSDVPPPQVPFWQATPDGQARPQFPQLAGSFIMSVQIVDPCGPGHIFGALGGQVVPPPVPHMPPWHATPAAQTWPQRPQFRGSLARLVHNGVPGAPQSLGCVAGQAWPPPQVPFTHATPLAQVRPQPPQFAASLIGSAQ